MKPLRIGSVLALAISLCGCESIVKSTQENALPKTSDPLTGIRYYLPRGKVKVEAAWNQIIPGWEPAISTVIEADPTACYRIDRNANAFFDDDISLQVDPTTGLLQNVSATSTDESVAAFSSLASGVVTAFTFGANLAAASGVGRGAELTADEQREFDQVKSHAVLSKFSVKVDPHQPMQTCYVVEPDNNSHSSRIFAKYEIRLSSSDGSSLPTSEGVNTNGTMNGIVIRTAIPYILKITGTFYREGERPMSPQTVQQVVMLPDVDHDYFLPLTRLPLVTTSTKITLANGIVQSLQRSRPSMINAIAGLPKNILSALLPLPSAVKK